MTLTTRARLFAVAGLAAIAAACSGGAETEEAQSWPEMSPPAGGVDVAASFTGLDGEPTGRAVVTAGPNGLLIRVDVQDLAEGFHALHLHQVGDCSDNGEGFQASGSHINPAGSAHGLLNPDGYEQADLPNIYVSPSGQGRGEFFAPGVSLEAIMDADGFAMLMHESPDDHQTQPIGGAGGRVACAAFAGNGQ